MSPIVPVIVGAIADTVRHAMTKENLKSTSTAGAAIIAAGTATNITVNPPTTVEEVVLNAVLAVVALVLFFVKQRESKK